MSETPVYMESQRTYNWSWVVLLLSGLVLLTMWTSKLRTQEVVIILGVLIVTGVSLWGFLVLKVVITATEIRFGFPFWRKRLAISSVEVGDIINLPYSAGIGVHRKGSAWVYNARFGRGVEIRSSGHKYWIGSDRPERLQMALMESAARRVQS